MNRTQTLQAVLDYIDDNITEEISMAMIAEKAGYSAYHFSRIFTEAIGISPMSYVTWRKMQFALYDLSHGKKVIDVAMEYGDVKTGLKKLTNSLLTTPHFQPLSTSLLSYLHYTHKHSQPKQKQIERLSA